MKATILLNHSESIKKIEEEEKTRFLKYILEQMGVPIQDFWTSDDPLSVEQRIHLRGILSSFSIQVIDDRDGLLQIYVEGEKVATFKKPTYKLKRDLSELDPKKQLYLEMTIDCESLFEEKNETTE